MLWREREREREREIFFSFRARACVLLFFCSFSSLAILHFFFLAKHILNKKNERTKRRATAELFTARMRFVSWQRDDDDDDDEDNNNNNNHE